MKIIITPQMRLQLSRANTMEIVVPELDELVANMEAILLMLRKETNTNAALVKAKAMLHQSIAKAKAAQAGEGT